MAAKKYRRFLHVGELEGEIIPKTALNYPEEVSYGAQRFLEFCEELSGGAV